MIGIALAKVRAARPSSLSPSPGDFRFNRATEAGWAIWGQKLRVLAGFEPANPEKLLNRLIVVLGRGVGGCGWDGSTVIVADGPSCGRAS